MLGFSRQERVNRQLRNAAEAGDTVAIARALDAGADIETPASEGFWNMRPVGIAAYYGKVEAVRLLVQKGAKVDARDSDGDTALIYAVRKGNRRLVAALLELGAKPDAVSERGESPATLAQYKHKAALAGLFDAPAVAEGKKKHEDARIAPLGDTVTVLHQIGNRVLEETYNFACKERISLLRNGIDGPVEAMTRESFDALRKNPALRHAFEIYAGRGGLVPESDIFPDTPTALPKPKIQQGKQP